MYTSGKNSFPTFPICLVIVTLVMANCFILQIFFFFSFNLHFDIHIAHEVQGDSGRFSAGNNHDHVLKGSNNGFTFMTSDAGARRLVENLTLLSAHPIRHLRF